MQGVDPEDGTPDSGQPPQGPGERPAVRWPGVGGGHGPVPGTVYGGPTGYGYGSGGGVGPAPSAAGYGGGHGPAPTGTVYGGGHEPTPTGTVYGATPTGTTYGSTGTAYSSAAPTGTAYSSGATTGRPRQSWSEPDDWAEPDDWDDPAKLARSRAARLEPHPLVVLVTRGREAYLGLDRSWQGLIAATAAVLVFAVAMLAGAAVPDGSPVAYFGSPGQPRTSATPQSSASIASVAPYVPPTTVTANVTWYSWSYVDLRTGNQYSSSNGSQNSVTASMIKAWLGADYLRKFPDPSTDWLSTISTMVRDSDNNAASRIYNAIGGEKAMLGDLQTVCGIKGPYISGQYGWGSTFTSAKDAAAIGACIANRQVASDKWTRWLLDEMRQIRGEGDFGIRFAFPEPLRSTIATKNGWVSVNGTWYLNCLGIADGEWVLVVETKLPETADRAADIARGSQACIDVAKQVIPNPV